MANLPGDRKALLLSSNFTFDPGTSQCVSYALIHSQGELDQESPVQTLKDHSDQVQEQFNSFFSCLAPKVDIQVLEDGDGNYQFYNLNNNDNFFWTINGVTTTELFPAVHVEADQVLDVLLVLSNQCGTDAQYAVLQDGVLPDHLKTDALDEVTVHLNNNFLQVNSSINDQLDIILFDGSGRIIASKTVLGSGSIGVSNLSQGVYIALVQDKFGRVVNTTKEKL